MLSGWGATSSGQGKRGPALFCSKLKCALPAAQHGPLQELPHSCSAPLGTQSGGHLTFTILASTPPAHSSPSPLEPSDSSGSALDFIFSLCFFFSRGFASQRFQALQEQTLSLIHPPSMYSTYTSLSNSCYKQSTLNKSCTG